MTRIVDCARPLVGGQWFESTTGYLFARVAQSWVRALRSHTDGGRLRAADLHRGSILMNGQPCLVATMRAGDGDGCAERSVVRLHPRVPFQVQPGIRRSNSRSNL